MNNIKVKRYKRVLKEVAEKCDGGDDFINNITDEIRSQEKFSTDELIYFLVGFLQFMFPC